LRLYHVKDKAYQFLYYIGRQGWKIYDYVVEEPKVIPDKDGGYSKDSGVWKSGWHFVWWHIKFFGLVFGVYLLWGFSFLNFFESFNAVWGIIFVFLSIWILGLGLESDRRGTKHH